MTSYIHIDSPVGPLLIEADGEVLRTVGFVRPAQPTPPVSPLPHTALLREVERQLRAYFAGDLRQFDLPLRLEGTPFRVAVWQALRDIPYGETTSYGELARRVGTPKGSRAVGLANGSNPIAIVVPCHRVIGSNGKLTGYGGGLDNKQTLLALERRHAANGANRATQ